ncbi:MAG: J domain-containing protein [Ruminococcus sp.]|nr:J domain-containing protein [Ruminococcus sp.]
MNDPYKVLGVSPNATEEEVKAAYKELVKKYHPDQFEDSPLKAEAEEKMSEINNAYDEIINSMRSNSYSYANADENSSGVNYYEVRRHIQAGDITTADNILDSVPQNVRNAEWYFLKGSVCYTRGWLNEAYQHFSTAVSMAPANAEYRSALNQMDQQRNGYMRGNPMGSYANGRNGQLDCCTTLCCADCCCEMMGGDLIPCC